MDSPHSDQWGKKTESNGGVFERIQLFSGDLLRISPEQLGNRWDGVGFVIIEGVIDPNVDRHALMERVAHGNLNPNLRNAGELATIRFD